MRLARISHAGVSSEDLRPGQWRPLTVDELVDLKKLYGVPKKVRAPSFEPATPRAVRGQKPARPDVRGSVHKPARKDERAPRVERGLRSERDRDRDFASRGTRPERGFDARGERSAPADRRTSRTDRGAAIDRRAPRTDRGAAIDRRAPRTDRGAATDRRETRADRGGRGSERGARAEGARPAQPATRKGSFERGPGRKGRGAR
jgi:23S rRNA pseudouridine2605 synthase